MSRYNKQRLAYHNAWRRRDRKKRPHIWYAKRQAWVRQQRLWYANLMSIMKCAYCKLSDHVVLDWAHIPGFKKLDNVAHMIGRCGIGKILHEMSKCLVLCANCHRRFDNETSS